MRPMDGDALELIFLDEIERLHRRLLETVDEDRKRDIKLFLHAAECAKQMIHHAPTIDPESLRKKGEWEMVDEYCCHAKEFRCSACGGSAYYDHYTRRCDYDFCPNCGADMRD